MYRAKIVNLMAGPGAGKSTMRASVFSELKWLGIDCEEAPEYAKDLTWEGRLDVLINNQDYVFGKQLHRIKRLANQVDVIVTDSPLIFSAIYGQRKFNFVSHVIDTFNEFDNLNYFLLRRKEYNPNGRNQTFEEACQKDVEIRGFLEANSLKYKPIPGEKPYVIEIVGDILRSLKK